MDYETIITEASLIAVAAEWQQLHARMARFPFADPKSFIAWWQIRGKPSGRRLHVVAGRRDGRLVTLAPLVVTRRWGLRILEWGGSELYDYGDVLADGGASDYALWNIIRRSNLYDFGILRDVHPNAACRDAIRTFAQETRSSQSLQIRLDFPSSYVWMQALSASTRSYCRRAESKLLRIAPLRFRVCCGKPIPTRILDVLLRQKAEWLRAHQKISWMSDEASDSATLLHHIAEAAADMGYLHLSWLDCGGSVIATHLGFQHRGLLHWYIPTYALDWSKYAPGRLLLLKLIEWSIDHGLSRFDFMRGEEPYKAHLANARCELTDFTFAGSQLARITAPWFIPWYMRRQSHIVTDAVVRTDLLPENS